MLLFIVFSGLFLVSQANENQAEIDYYEDLINEAVKNASTYKFPTDARQFSADGQMKHYGTYDFVVIGAGSGGSVAANRLSEVKQWNVLVLEAGQWSNNLTDIPAMATADAFSGYNWGYKTTPQETSCLGMENNECVFTRGRAVGGSSMLNGLFYSRGYKQDYENWANIAGNKRWGYDSVLKYFKKSENFVHNDPEAPYDPAYHGKGGYFQVEYDEPRSPILNRFLRANVELGYKIADYNANQLGASVAQHNTRKGKRLDSGTTFLRPIEIRPNLKILSESYVTRIRIDNEVATGVEFTYFGRNYFVDVGKEVILSAGSIDSPKILMLSGVGPKRHLEELGIKVIHNLPVGEKLLDNPFVQLTFTSNYTEADESLKDNVEEYLNGEGPLTIAYNYQGLAFYESHDSKGTGIPNIELMIEPPRILNPLSQKSFSLTDQTYTDLWKNKNPFKTFIMFVILAHPISYGNVKIKSKNSLDFPLINPNVLSDSGDKDISMMYEGIQLALKLTQAEAFKSIDTKLIGGPLTACKTHEYLSKDYWYCTIRQLGGSFLHPSGTCGMGTDPKYAVVDSELKVFGINNLRVSDISVMPVTLAGHTNAPAVMVGEMLGDLVKSTYNITL